MKNNLKKWQGTACVIGVDWGDSGKGRIVDDLAQRAHIVARFNGGSNTGHTVKNRFGKFALHIVPSGIFNRHAICLIGRGVALDLESLIEDEMQQLKKAGVPWHNLLIDEQAILTMPWHKLKDGIREKYRSSKIGTTGRGVGPTYADKTERVGLTVADIFEKDFKNRLNEEIAFQNKFFVLNLSSNDIYSKYQEYKKLVKPYITQTIPVLKNALKKGKNILFEGAQGWLLDVDHGTYPFVTSSNTGVIGIWRSFELHPSKISHVIGITKAYMTRVGNGSMPTKITSSTRKKIIEKGQEIGTTSGRVRDPGWLDLVLIKEACDNNQVTHLAITKLDVLSKIKRLKLCVNYKINGQKLTKYVMRHESFLNQCKPVYEELPGWDEDISDTRILKDLPENAKNYLKKIEDFLGIPIEFIGVGPAREEAIYV